MYFKYLELFGFKSFADRTRLDFEPGITAIVGPNGCGKSNIADSIKWVLGEQSARMLRGGKMEDVIFNGTDGKEPVNYAEVSLTLSNQDRLLSIEYDEVTVTRRLYRSGESEYLLNKTPVRLKDISELFMGTGIGTSAYSLIEQGRIDQILSSKPEDRREVFEEASGITKYKSKKKEALRRLEDTEQNLIRINDIIAEVKRQINSIERQARKAERYKEQYEGLKELELKLSRLELEILRQKLSESSKNIDEHKLRESELNTELQRLTRELSELNAKRSQVESERMDFKSSIIETDSAISKFRDKISLNKERIAELRGKRASLEAEIQKNQENIKSQYKEVENLREKTSLLEIEGKEWSRLLSEKEKRLREIYKGITENEAIISTSKANIVDIASRESKLKNQLAKISTSLGTHDARVKRLETELEAISEEKNSLNVKLNDAINEADSVETGILSLRVKRDEIFQNISKLSSSIEELLEESEKSHRTLATNKSRLEVLEDAKIKYEGFSSGVRSILGKTVDTQQQIEGMRDVLANILNVKKGYERAIESCLGENLESIVVDNMESAMKAINFLKENSCGKASFIHPQSFDNLLKEQDGQDLKDSRILGRAIDFIDIDEIFRNTLRYLLRNIFIVRNLEEARAIMEEHGGSGQFTFVTILGEIVKSGFISGGDIVNEGITLLNRDLEMKELSQAIIGFERRAQQIGEDKSRMEQKKIELEKEMSDVDKQLNEKGILFANATTRRANIEENIKGLDDEISLVNLELDEVRSEIERFKQEEGSAKKSLIEVEDEARFNGDRIKKSEGLINEHAKEKEQLLIETAEQRTELGSLESKKEGLMNTLNILEISLKDAENSADARKIELEDSIRKVEGLTSGILNLEKEIKALSEARIKRNTEAEAVEKMYSEIMGQTRQGEDIFKQSEKEVNGIRSLLHEVDLKRAETNYGLDNLKQRIRDVYKVDLAEVQITEDWHSIEKEQLKKDVEDKRAKLDAMGPVNLVAIEEHTELQDRYAFLTNQRDDLLKAKDSLLKAIAKINKTTKELFIETFNNIQVEFRNFFKMLFGGGDGELILLDEGNVLESGIEIVARPQGKRLQNVSLLSGGEKALTAIALIFAIFKVKPSPFCVLDEIDAPLDESNIGLFSRSLEMFTKTSQFIIITHNKKTIDMADVMYGITMQESGISKVVSVKFSDAKKQEDARQEVEPTV